MCECERSLETPLHVLLECDKYIVIRQQLINEVNRIGLKWPISPNLLIENKHFIQFQQLLNLL